MKRSAAEKRAWDIAVLIELDRRSLAVGETGRLNIEWVRLRPTLDALTVRGLVRYYSGSGGWSLTPLGVYVVSLLKERAA